MGHYAAGSLGFKNIYTFVLGTSANTGTHSFHASCVTRPQNNEVCPGCPGAQGWFNVRGFKYHRYFRREESCKWGSGNLGPLLRKRGALLDDRAWAGSATAPLPALTPLPPDLHLLNTRHHHILGSSSTILWLSESYGSSLPLLNQIHVSLHNILRATSLLTWLRRLISTRTVRYNKARTSGFSWTSGTWFLDVL